MRQENYPVLSAHKELPLEALRLPSFHPVGLGEELVPMCWCMHGGIIKKESARSKIGFLHTIVLPALPTYSIPINSIVLHYCLQPFDHNVRSDSRFLYAISWKPSKLRRHVFIVISLPS